MEAATVTHRPTMRSEQKKVLQERTVATLILDNFVHYDIQEGQGLPDSTNAFFFKDHKGPDIVVNRTIVQFYGPNAQEIQTKAVEFFRFKHTSQHRVEKESYSGGTSFVLYLEKIQPASFDSLYGRADNAPAGRPAVNDLGGGLSPQEMFLADPALKRGLEAVRLLHESKLLLGTKNQGEFVFLPGPVPSVAVEYNYFDETEASVAMELSKKFFGYEPVSRAGNKNSERVVLQFDLNASKGVNFQRLRQKTIRVIDGRQLSAVQVARFIVMKMMRAGCSVNNPPSLDFAVFTLEHPGKRKEALEQFDLFGIKYVEDVLDARCFRIKNTDMIGTQMTVVQSSDTDMNGKTTETGRQRSDQASLVREVFQSVLGWQDRKEYQAQRFRRVGDNMGYISVSTSDEIRMKLMKDSLPKLQAFAADHAVEVTFEGTRSNVKSLYFYFPSRAAVIGVERDEEVHDVSDPSQIPSVTGVAEGESLALRIFRASLPELTEVDRQTIVGLLGITEGPSKEELEAHDAECDRKRAEELEKRFEGHVVLDKSEEMVQRMMRDYHGRLFMNLRDFLKVKQDA